MSLAPIDLKILLHCYTSPQRHHSMDAIPGAKAVDMLLATGMIERYDRTFKTTAKGDFYVEYLLSVPLPVNDFKIPENK